MWQATENSDGQNSACSQWNGDSSEGYKQVSRQGAMTGVTTLLSIGPWGRLYKRIPAQMRWGQGK